MSDLETLLREVCLRGLHTVRQPRNAIARADLRRACEQGQAALAAIAAARRTESLTPGNERPEPPLHEYTPTAPAPQPAFKPRLPYAEDD